MASGIKAEPRHVARKKEEDLPKSFFSALKGEKTLCTVNFYCQTTATLDWKLVKIIRKACSLLVR